MDKEAAPPSYQEVVAGGMPSAPPPGGQFQQGPYPPQGSQYPPPAQPLPQGQPAYPPGPQQQPPYGQPSYTPGAQPGPQVSGGGGTQPHYTYNTIQVGPGYQYSTGTGNLQGVTPGSAGYQTTPLAYGHQNTTAQCTKGALILFACFFVIMVIVSIIVPVIVMS